MKESLEHRGSSLNQKRSIFRQVRFKTILIFRVGATCPLIFVLSYFIICDYEFVLYWVEQGNPILDEETKRTRAGLKKRISHCQQWLKWSRRTNQWTQRKPMETRIHVKRCSTNKNVTFIFGYLLRVENQNSSSSMTLTGMRDKSIENDRRINTKFKNERRAEDDIG